MVKRKRLLFIMAGLGLLLFTRPDLLLSKIVEDPMVQREERLKAFRKERDRFFKEDPRSPLRESDRKKFKGLLYYPIDLRYAMTESIEKYLVEPKPIYVTLPTNKEVGKRYVKYGRFKFKWGGKGVCPSNLQASRRRRTLSTF
jgi:uncharacterized protein (DUF1684 family)